MKTGQKVSNDIVGTRNMGRPEQDVVAHGTYDYVSYEGHDVRVTRRLGVDYVDASLVVSVEHDLGVGQIRSPHGDGQSDGV